MTTAAYKCAQCGAEATSGQAEMNEWQEVYLGNDSWDFCSDKCADVFIDLRGAKTPEEREKILADAWPEKLNIVNELEQSLMDSETQAEIIRRLLEQLKAKDAEIGQLRAEIYNLTPFQEEGLCGKGGT